MDTFDRRSEIIRLLQDRGRASTRELSERFGVSEVTIRNDLELLEQQGWLERVHGGAAISPRLLAEQPFAVRQQQHVPEKMKLARYAVELLRPGDTILLDSSTTVFELARAIAGLNAGGKRFPLRVVTNNLYAVGLLAACPAIELIILGGVVRGETGSVVGPFATEMLRSLHADKGFFSASGLTLTRGFTDADIREVEMKRAMLAAASQVYVLLDASKFDQQSFLSFAPLSAIHHLITEAGIPPEYVTACQQFGITLSIV